MKREGTSIVTASLTPPDEPAARVHRAAGSAPVEVWFAGTRGPADLSVLGDAELDRLRRLRRPEDRARFATGHLLVREVLSRATGVAPHELVFDRACLHCGHPSHGKPRVVPPSGPSFSLGSRDGIVVLAVCADADVGVDVERVPPRDEADAVVARFTRRERERYAALPDTQRAPVFAKWWSRKEALAKAIGLGLALPLDAVDVSDAGRVSGWDVADLPPGPGWHSAVAVRAPPTAQRTLPIASDTL